MGYGGLRWTLYGANAQLTPSLLALRFRMKLASSLASTLF